MTAKLPDMPQHSGLNSLPAEILRTIVEYVLQPSAADRDVRFGGPIEGGSMTTNMGLLGVCSKTRHHLLNVISKSVPCIEVLLHPCARGGLQAQDCDENITRLFGYSFSHSYRFLDKLHYKGGQQLPLMRIHISCKHGHSHGRPLSVAFLRPTASTSLALSHLLQWFKPLQVEIEAESSDLPTHRQLLNTLRDLKTFLNLLPNAELRVNQLKSDGSMQWLEGGWLRPVNGMRTLEQAVHTTELHLLRIHDLLAEDARPLEQANTAFRLAVGFISAYLSMLGDSLEGELWTHVGNDLRVLLQNYTFIILQSISTFFLEGDSSIDEQSRLLDQLRDLEVDTFAAATIENMSSGFGWVWRRPLTGAIPPSGVATIRHFAPLLKVWAQWHLAQARHTLLSSTKSGRAMTVRDDLSVTRSLAKAKIPVHQIGVLSNIEEDGASRENDLAWLKHIRLIDESATNFQRELQGTVWDRQRAQFELQERSLRMPRDTTVALWLPYFNALDVRCRHRSMIVRKEQDV